MSVRDISLDKRHLRLSVDTFDRYGTGSGILSDSMRFGRNWDGSWQTAPNAWRVRSIDEIDYTPGPHATLAGGTGWDDEWRTAPNYARIIGEDDANGYSVGSGDAPYSAGIGLSTPIISNVDIVNVRDDDNGFQIGSGGGGIAWLLDPDEPWTILQIGCLIHVPQGDATGLTGTPRLRVGLCSSANVPGIVADGSVDHAIFWQSTLASWTYALGSLQVANSNTAQLGRIVAGTLGTANISTLSRVGAITATPSVGRCPIVVTITKGSPNWGLDVARRTSSSGGSFLSEATMRAAVESLAPAAVMGASHAQHGNTIAIDEGANGLLRRIFVGFTHQCYVSGIYVMRLN